VPRQRLTRKEIKQPDQFISYTAQAINWAKEHTKQLSYGALGVLIIIGLTAGWSAWQRQRHRKAEVLLYQAVKLLNTSRGDTADTNTTAKPDLEKAMQQLQSITRDYRGTQASAMAHWYLGHLYFERGDYAAALAAYEQTRRALASDNQRLMPALVSLDMGYAQEASGACDKAIASYENVLQSSAAWLRGEAFLGMGRCYERTGATDKALAIYDRALSDPEVNDTVRQHIEERQAYLQAGRETPRTSSGERSEATKR
jgi:tetratricopeptide (TPR) repeat protein